MLIVCTVATLMKPLLKVSTQAENECTNNLYVRNYRPEHVMFGIIIIFYFLPRQVLQGYSFKENLNSTDTWKYCIYLTPFFSLRRHYVLGNNACTTNENCCYFKP